MSAVLSVVLRLMRFDLRRYLIGAFLWLPVGVLPLAGGLLLQRLFNQLTGDRAVEPQAALWLCAAFIGVEVVRGLIMVLAWSYGVYWWDAAATVLRANILRSLLTARGPAATRLPHSSTESLARLRDDVADLVSLTDESVPLMGSAFFSGAALTIMAAIDPVITLVLVLPMLAIGVLTPLMSRTIQRLRRRARTLGAAVTSFIGEMFSGVLALKTAGADTAALARLRILNLRRRDAAVADRLATDLVDTATNATVDISVGLVLLLAASAMRRGDFTVGDFALFTSYLSWLTQLPRTVGGILYRLPQGAVALERLTRLLAAHQDARDLTRDTRVWFTEQSPPATPAAPQRDDPLQVLEARGLTVRFDDTGRGVYGIDLRIPRGSFTVITGAVGAGNTTWNL